uniref:Uncharacterized protein n=1 Tax=mine drainage metagenome TaxID=410659 RepID=E6QIU8_9ZZZZ
MYDVQQKMKTFPNRTIFMALPTGYTG